MFNRFCLLNIFAYICRMKAYVYTHTRLDTNEVFYVGIGTQDNYRRASRKHNRTNYWNNIIKKCGWRVDIVFDNLSWEDACKKEIELIKMYGRIDLGTGTLVNLTNGGDGSLGLKHSLETRQKMSRTRKGMKYSDEHKLKTKQSMMGKNCKKVIDTSNNIIYNSVSDAASFLNISTPTLSRYLNGVLKNKTQMKYLK